MADFSPPEDKGDTSYLMDSVDTIHDILFQFGSGCRPVVMGERTALRRMNIRQD